MSRHWRVLTSLAAIILGLGLTKGGVAQLPSMDLSIKPTSVSATVAEQFLLNQINTERAMAGMAPLKIDNSLRLAAEAHAMEMARTNIMLSHANVSRA